MVKNVSGRTNTASWIEDQHRWRIRVTRDGITKAFYCSTPGRKGQAEANRLADEWLMTGKLQSNTGVTVEQTVQLYKNYHLKLESIRRGIPVPKEPLARDLGNMRQPISHLENRLAPYYKKQLRRLTDGDLQGVLDQCAAEGKAKKTLQNIRSALTAWLKWCRQQGLTDYRPEDLTVPAGARNRQKEILQPEHLRILFSCTKTVMFNQEVEDDLVYAYRLAVLTGLRPGELLALNWNDWEGSVLHVRGAVNDSGRHTSGKNENAIRDIRLIPLAEEQLKLHCLRTGKRDGAIFSVPAQYVYRNHWYRYCEHNGIPKVTPYELRHTFVSICQKLPEGMVKQLVGHSKSMDTFGVYGHGVSGYDTLAAGQLSAVFADLIG